MNCNKCGSELGAASRFCPSCGSIIESSTSPVSAAKASNRRVAMILFPVAIIAGAIIFIRYIDPGVNSIIKDQPVVAAPLNYDSNFVTMTNIRAEEEGGDLVFSLADLKQFRLVRFEYAGGQTLRYVMAYLAPTGQVVTAISISDHCGSTEFKIKDNKIYCAHCPSYWDMMTMEAYACCAKYFPDPIPSRVAGDKVHVSKVFVEKWAGRL